MNYTLHYQKLIEKVSLEGRKRVPRKNKNYVYYEEHHIIPRCMGGTDNKENLILLTAEEHFLAHLLLVKIHPNNNKLTAAAIQLTHNNGYRISNKLYGWLRRQHADNVSELHKDKKVGMHNKKHSEETRVKISAGNKGKIVPKGKDSPSYGLKRSEETRRKISIIKTGSTHASHSEETKNKIREKRKLQTRTRDKPISVNEIVFSSATKAAEYVGITVSAFCKRMRSGKFPEYFYL